VWTGEDIEGQDDDLEQVDGGGRKKSFIGDGKGGGDCQGGEEFDENSE